MDDSDLAGPMLFFVMFGFFLLFSGKLHFGYIYGLALMGSVALHTILSLMTPDGPSSPRPSHATPQYSSSGYPGDSSAHGDDGKGQLSSTLTFTRSASVLGYCLLPLVMTSLVGIVIPMDTTIGYILTSAAIVWCTASSSGMFCAVGRMRHMRGLVAYPLGLFYVGFGLMSIFSSRGAGALAKAADVS
jgi:protein YIPF5/7